MKVGVMASGRGSNFQAIIDAGVRGETPNVEIVHLIVNKKNAYAIERAKKHEIDFDKCIDNKKVEDHILEDRINAVKKFKINSTPTLIINNKKFDKPINYKNLKKTLEKMI